MTSKIYSKLKSQAELGLLPIAEIYCKLNINRFLDNRYKSARYFAIILNYDDTIQCIGSVDSVTTSVLRVQSLSVTKVVQVPLNSSRYVIFSGIAIQSTYTSLLAEVINYLIHHVPESLNEEFTTTLCNLFYISPKPKLTVNMTGESKSCQNQRRMKLKSKYQDKRQISMC